MVNLNQEPPRWFEASDRGSRQVNADAVGAYTDPATGNTVYALADGIGDNERAARAATLAVDAAIHSSPALGPAAAILAAQEAIRKDPSASDCVLVVVMPDAESGYQIAWVGDARAYSWTQEGIRQLTVDHTVAQYFRNRHQATTPRMEHMVTTSVSTTRPDEIGTAWAKSRSGLLLTSDGVHKTLPVKSLWSALREPDRAATSLVKSAISAGSTDNTTALVIMDALAADIPRQNSGVASDSGPTTEQFTLGAA